ncbi:MAG: NADPH-dependent F420 reductase [Planctomycetota bacterium]
MAKKIGVVGSGTVGRTLADGFLKHGHEVMVGSREPAKLAEWQAKAGAKGSVGSFQAAAAFGEIVVVTVRGQVAEAVVKSFPPGVLDGKTVIDTCNPIGTQPPVNGVLNFFTGPNESLHEKLQALAPAAHFVKAFSCVGSASMVNPDFGGVKPTMFLCGNDAKAKQEVTAILTQFGWEWEDMGGAEAARAIEPLCILWCIPGLRGGSWSHAFKLLKK